MAGPARATWWALALIATATIFLHHEVLLGGDVYHMDDAADGYYPSHVAIARAYRHGELPAWERGAGTGWPLVADPYYGPFYPLGAIFGIVGAARGLGVQIALHTILCAAGMLLLLRRRGLSPWSAAFGAASLALSSFMVCRTRHIIFPEGLAWLSFALAGAEGYVQTRARRELVLVAGAVGLMLLCGALPLLPFFGLFAVAYLLPRILAASRPLACALALAGAAGLGLLLACAQLVPTLMHLPLSPRALGTSPEFAGSYAWPNLAYLATLFVPDLFGVEDRARWFGAFNHWEMAAYYTGLWAALFAPFAWSRGRRDAAALWIAALLGIGLAFGDAGPLHGWFYRHVPLYAALRCPTRALVMTMLALCILGAEGLEELGSRTPARSRAWSAIGALAAVAGLVLAWLLVRTHALHFAPGPIPPGIAEGRRAFAHFAVVLGGGLAILGLLRGGARKMILPAFALLAVGDLLVADRGYVQPMPAAYVEGTDRFQAVDWLLAQRGPLPIGDRFASDSHGPFRLHNVGMTYGLEGAAAYSSVQILRYENFLEVLATGRGLPSPLRSDPAAADVRRFDSPLVDLLNVRWVISDHLPATGWVERFHPRPDSRGAASRFEPSWDRRLGVWENPHPLPRAFLVHAARVVAGEAAEQRALAQLDPRRWALVDRAPSISSLPVDSSSPIDPARVVLATRDALRIETDATTAGVLVLSEAFYPGWSATVDGRPATLLRADYAFRGVALEAGPHRVELRYRPKPVYLGLGISAAALLVLLVLALGAGLGAGSKRPKSGKPPTRKGGAPVLN
jgi:hypothetical protein